MFKKAYMKLLGTGSYLPKKVVSNSELSEMVDTSDEWIKQRVGISSRHFANTEETTFYMAKESALEALSASNIKAADIGLILVATSTADYIMPSVAARLQSELGVPSCAAFDINAACSGFVYLIDIAKQYIENGLDKPVLLVASESMSRIIDWNDRSSCVLFGDGSGAAVFGSSDNPGVLTSIVYSDGNYSDILSAKNSLPVDLYGKEFEKSLLTMQGKKVFRQAVLSLTSLVSELLESSGLSAKDIDFLVPHQANYRIIKATADKLCMPMEKVILTLQNHGNTSAASIPLALDFAVKNNIIKKGDNILLEAFGAGIVWGGCIISY
jgi:3-oxoacyl-[acyl-carrier-protein] synthase III